jgi:hypothetical protein
VCPNAANVALQRRKKMLDTTQNTLDTALEDDPASGIYRVGRV